MTDNGFSATLNTGATQAQKFGQTVNNNAGYLVNFNAKSLESRRAIGTLAAAANVGAGSIMHYLHAFALFGPEVGAAVAAVLFLTETYKGQAERADEATKKNIEFYNSMKKIREFQTGVKETEAQAQVHEMGKRFTAIQQERLLIRDSWWHFLTTSPKEDKQRLEELDAQFEQARKRYQELKGMAGGFQERHLGTAVHGQQLGVLRLEHTMQSRDNPLLAEAQKQTALLQQIAGHNAGGSSQGEAPGRLGGLMNWRWLFKSRGFTPQAGL
jgi:hypothetical protein